MPVAPLPRYPRSRGASDRPGDVQVRPGRVAHELAEEDGRADRPAPALAEVLHVRDVGAQRLLLELHQRQPPERLAGPGRRRRAARPASASLLEKSPATQCPSATTQAPVRVARSMSAARLLLHRVGQDVPQDQPALGIGVGHLHRLPQPGDQDVARTVRGAAGHVLRRAEVPVHREGRLELGGHLHRPEHRGAAGHVGLHVRHVLGGLQRQAAGVEGDGLAHQRHRPRPWPPRPSSAGR